LSFSLLTSAVDSGSAAAFLPEVAAKFLPEERIAQVRAKGMEAMDRDLSLVWNPRVADSRASVRRALIRLRRVFGQRPFGSITTELLEKLDFAVATAREALDRAAMPGKCQN
jgi:hypothetical protein